jgi:hypothetical protein
MLRLNLLHNLLGTILIMHTMLLLRNNPLRFPRKIHTILLTLLHRNRRMHLSHYNLHTLNSKDDPDLILRKEDPNSLNIHPLLLK